MRLISVRDPVDSEWVKVAACLQQAQEEEDGSTPKVPHAGLTWPHFIVMVGYFFCSSQLFVNSSRAGMSFSHVVMLSFPALLLM